ncbi:hypothetical protein QJQ45_018195 [Haematococcus lacustris]|nr:hypothetical protein QJQ45_018195 [Haematococcus lacustris]
MPLVSRDSAYGIRVKYLMRCQGSSRTLASSLPTPNCKTVYNQLQRLLVRKRQLRHPMLMPVFQDPSNQALLAKLQELGSINMWG